MTSAGPPEGEVLMVLPEGLALDNGERAALRRLSPWLSLPDEVPPPSWESDAALLLKRHLLRRSGGREIRRTTEGKPFIDGQPFFWSLSHDPSLVCAAVAPTAVGIDVEPVAPVTDAAMAALCRVVPQRWARWVMGASEGRARALRFARAWTTAEAALKAMGVGFSHDGVELAGWGGEWLSRGRIVNGCMISVVTRGALLLRWRFVGRTPSGRVGLFSEERGA